MEYLVNGTDMMTVADAIRERGGTTAPLRFPDGMASAIRGIQSGGGDLSSVDVYIADFTAPADLIVTAGAVDKYARIVAG
nr:MAG TPA: 2-(3-amino-3-carboxypropyl)histidine synthase [Caudoviricetes sp.]